VISGVVTHTRWRATCQISAESSKGTRRNPLISSPYVEWVISLCSNAQGVSLSAKPVWCGGRVGAGGQQASAPAEKKDSSGVLSEKTDSVAVST